MRKYLLINLVILLLAVSSLSQTSVNSSPINWQKYKVSDRNLIVTFPKLPVRLDYKEWCRQTEVRNYYAYADEAVYELRIYEKSNEDTLDFCSVKEKFSDKSFTNYLSRLQSESNFLSVESPQIGDNKFLKLEKEEDAFKYTKWLLNDTKKSRWIELSVTTYLGKSLNENKFVESLSLQSDASAIDIKDGADSLLGDDLPAQDKPVEEKKSTDSKSSDANSTKLNIVVKPKPIYTDKARKKNTVGNIRIRVTFLPNGSVGDITPLNELKNGLTEQAITAAKRMVFLPVKRNDVKIAVSKVVVYNFSIY